MSPSRASLAAKSAAELPLMPTWPGTQIKIISFLSVVNSIYSSKICTKIGWSYLRLYIACSDERESDNLENDFSPLRTVKLFESQKRVARSSAVNMELSSGS